MYFYVYRIDNKLNGRFYVGRRSSILPPQEDTSYWGSGNLIIKALERYGIENFVKTVIRECDSFEDSCELEAQIVNEYYLSSPYTYNIALGGLNSPMVDSVREKLSLAMKGREFTEDHRKKLSAAGQGREFSDPWRAQLSEAKNRPWKVSKVLNDPKYISMYKRLDEVYEIYKGFSFSVRGEYRNFKLVMEDLFGVRTDKGRGVLRYFEIHGDPRKDPEWLSFTEI